MFDFFGTDWDNLTATALEDFLADAGEEGWTWEAKGGEQPHAHSVVKAVCGFANARGGFLIVGAQRGTGAAWSLPGCRFKGEASTWLTSVIAAGVKPQPVFDVRVFERGEGRKAAVVAVAPAAVPPCMTATGVVYIRVSGQTVPVVDQRVLADLLGRGIAAREQAEALAVRAANRALEGIKPAPQETIALSLALCPVEGPKDKARVLFERSTAMHICEVVERGLQPPADAGYGVHHHVGQDVLGVWVESWATGRSWAVSASWDGAVSAVFATNGDMGAHDVVARVSQAWPVLSEVVAELGGVGEAHLVVVVRSEHSGFDSWGSRPVPVQRWTHVAPPSDSQLGSVEREIHRGFGHTVWEPEM